MKEFDIESATTNTYALFNKIRHKAVQDFPPGMRYWDIVVLTASDDDQRSAYDIQIREKLKREEIPSGVKYHVFADPPGPRIGCGGATMQAIVNLQEIYGANELSNKYILLINAGGQSQRLPSASVLGKIFSPLPIGEDVQKGGEDCKVNCDGTNWQLLELKLACYTPLLQRMKPGYMHVASDTIEVFDLGDVSKDLSTSSDWNFEQPGMTALAHPSSLDIGRTHGVFVLDKQDSVSNNLAELRNFCEVLQKPSLDEMRRKGAVIKNTETCRIEGSASAINEFVYTDSAFYFDHAFASKLATFYQDYSPLGCEIDGYGDFMRSLGPLADDQFTTDTRNVSTSSPAELTHLIETRKRLFHCLRGTPLNVVVMNASKFYHLGTMKEYIENLCEDEELSRFLGFGQTVFSAISTASVAGSSFTSRMTPARHDYPGPGRRLVHSIVSESTDIGCSSILEYCRLTYPQGFKIGRGCILSNCSYTARSISLRTLPSGDTSTNNSSNNSVIIPSDTFLHTIPVRFSSSVNVPGSVSKEALLPLISPKQVNADYCSAETRSAFVTLVFHTDDDLKKTGSADSIRWLGEPLSVILERLLLSKVTVFSNTENVAGSLWHARVFPVFDSMEKSFEVAVAIANNLVPSTLSVGASGADASGLQWLSAAEVMQYKDIQSMLEYRAKLSDAIRSANVNHNQ